MNILCTQRTYISNLQNCDPIQFKKHSSVLSTKLPQMIAKAASERFWARYPAALHRKTYTYSKHIAQGLRLFHVSDWGCT